MYTIIRQNDLGLVVEVWNGEVKISVLYVSTNERTGRFNVMVRKQDDVVDNFSIGSLPSMK